MLHIDRDGDSWEGNIYFVRCIPCDVRMMGKTEQDAITKWNLRANVQDMETPCSPQPVPLQGWECPRCRKIHGPFVQECGCAPPMNIRYTGGTGTDD